MRSIVLTVIGLLAVIVVVGCSKSAGPKDEPAEAEWTLVTLHIEGFQKSESGAT